VKLHRNEDRGIADHGWLKSRHSFSFANYYNPKMMGFGALRVINDDRVDASQGFGTHPHQNMEIISIPLKGALKHKDTMGNETIIRHGEVQAMSAGTGVMHSEYNHSAKEEVNFLQIWVLPKKQNIKPNYSQRSFDLAGRDNQLQLIVSPDGRNDSVQINQDAYFHLLDLKEGKHLNYQQIKSQNGLYIFLLEGELSVQSQKVSKRDGLAIEKFETVALKATQDAQVLLMEVPMDIA